MFYPFLLRIIVTAVAANTTPSDLHLFRNYTPPQNLISADLGNQPKPEEQLIWRAARATGAAPVYFRLGPNLFSSTYLVLTDLVLYRPFPPYVDGGLLSNNPTLDALTEIQEYNVAMEYKKETVSKPSVVVSLGTGQGPTREVMGRVNFTKLL